MAERLFDAIRRADTIGDPRFAANDARVINSDALDVILGDFIVTRTQAGNLTLFEAAEVTVGPVCAVEDLLAHLFVAGREAIVELDDPDLGTLPMHDIVPRPSAPPGTFRRPAPTVGQHAGEVMADLTRWESDAG